ncbi:MAG: hypothetical protein H7256_16750 [Bdellovibrio sp.]|nr:hypothetical protein [Bdellovibrio sp.]
MARPVKIISINVCSTTGAQLHAYYKQEKFSLNQIESKDKNELSHTTQIQFKNVSGQETEQYVQTGSYQLPVYETYKYQLIQKNKVTPLTIAKVGVAKVNIDLPNVQMLNQFVDQSVTSTNTTQINKADGPIVKEELQKAWLLLKRVGACCNESVCRQAMTSAGASPDSSGGMGTYVQ